MSLRHDELPPLTPAQQAEALRLAARLQAEATSTAEFLRAAEEAGIEPRFLREAIGRLPRPAAPRMAAPSFGVQWVSVGILLATLVSCVVFPLLSIPLLVSLLFALPPCSLGRPRRRTIAFVFAAWLLVDAVFMVYALFEGAWPNIDWGNFAWGLTVALILEALVAVSSVELARQMYRLQARLHRRKSHSL